LTKHGAKQLVFEQLFKQISPDEIDDDVFTLVGKIFPVVTVGAPDSCNAMVASGGGLGMMFRKPAAWCIFPSNRYTLELIEKKQTYTLSFFPDSHREQFMFFGTKSGRDSNKMKESELAVIETPLGNASFEEARLIIECRLTQISTPRVEDFYTEDAKAYLAEAYKDPGEVRKYVFGEIERVWAKKNG
jgi:flavin reductase (DIM6/NTAB) family NADH-FMN oxidoreductase RutF